MIDIDIPSGFNWTNPIIRPALNSNNMLLANKSARSLIPPVELTTYYVDPVFGLTGNPGTASEPMRTIYEALHNKNNVGQVLVAPGAGVTRDDGGWAAPTITTQASHVVIRPWNIRPGRPLVTNAWSHQEHLWTQETGNLNRIYTNGNRSGVLGVVDMAGGLEGRPLRYAQADAKADLQNRVGTYWFSGGSAISVNTINAQVPSPSLKVQVGPCASWKSNKDLTVIGIDFFGGFVVPDSSANITMIDCAAYCAVSDGTNVDVSGNGFSINTSGVTIMEACRSDYNTRDGFNYHASPTHGPGKVIESACWSTFTGSETNSNQNSTAHDGIKIIRINSLYTGGGTQCIADVNLNTQSWNAGITVGASQDGGTSVYLSDAEGWFDRCTISFAINTIVINGTGGLAYIHNTDPGAIAGPYILY